MPVEVKRGIKDYRKSVYKQVIPVVERVTNSFDYTVAFYIQNDQTIFQTLFLSWLFQAF